MRGDPRPRLLLGEPLAGVTTPDGSPVYAEPGRLWLPRCPRPGGPLACRHPARGGRSSGLVSREIDEDAPAGRHLGHVPRPILGAFDITVRGPLGRWMRRTIFIAEGVPGQLRGIRFRARRGVAGRPRDRAGRRSRRRSRSSRGQGARRGFPVQGAAPAGFRVQSAAPAGFRVQSAAPAGFRVQGAAAAGSGGPASWPAVGWASSELASGAEVSSGQLTIRELGSAAGLAAALYLARAPWRAPVIVPVLDDGVVELPPEVCDAGPLRVLLRAEDPWTATNWPDWPGRDSFACAAPGIRASADLEEDALSRFLAGTGTCRFGPAGWTVCGGSSTWPAILVTARRAR